MSKGEKMVSTHVGHFVSEDILKKLFPFTLSIDKIEDAIPVENNPIRVSFTLRNRSGKAVSGQISGLGGQFNVTNLVDGTSISDTFNCKAPAAGKGVPFSIVFYKLPIPAGEEFPPAVAEAGTTLDVAARYDLVLSSFHIDNTRALDEDTDYVSVSAQIGNQPPLQGSQFIGDVDNGDHAVGIRLGFFEIVPGGDSDLTFSFIILNKGYDPNVRDVLEKITAAAVTALSKIFPSYSGIFKFAGEILKYFEDILTVNCDGVVAADKIVFSSNMLNQLTSEKNIYTETRRYQGTDSDRGCGTNSDYSVTFLIGRH